MPMRMSMSMMNERSHAVGTVFSSNNNRISMPFTKPRSDSSFPRRKPVPLINFVSGKPIHPDDITYVRQQGSFQTNANPKMKSIPAMNRRLSFSGRSPSPPKRHYTSPLQHRLSVVTTSRSAPEYRSDRPRSHSYAYGTDLDNHSGKPHNKPRRIPSPPTTSSESSITSSSSSSLSISSPTSPDSTYSDHFLSASGNNTETDSDLESDANSVDEDQHEVKTSFQNEIAENETIPVEKKHHNRMCSSSNTNRKSQSTTGPVTGHLIPTPPSIKSSTHPVETSDGVFERSVQPLIPNELKNPSFAKWKAQKQIRLSQTLSRQSRASSLSLPPLTFQSSKKAKGGAQTYSPLTSRNFFQLPSQSSSLLPHKNQNNINIHNNRNSLHARYHHHHATGNRSDVNHQKRNTMSAKPSSSSLKLSSTPSPSKKHAQEKQGSTSSKRWSLFSFRKKSLSKS